MRSINFPKMFETSYTKTISDHDATAKNLNNLLHCEKGELFGDPYYGLKLKRYLFEQNNSILRDILIDEIYTQITLFMPQIAITRKDITIEQNRKGEKATLYVNIKCINRLDFTPDLYNIVLFQEDVE